MKITYEQAAYILDWMRPHKFARYCGSWNVGSGDEDGCHYYTLRCDIKWWIYLLMIVPVTIVEAIYSMWDGGLRGYRPSGRNVCFYKFFPYNDARYKRIEEVIGDV